MTPPLRHTLVAALLLVASLGGAACSGGGGAQADAGTGAAGTGAAGTAGAPGDPNALVGTFAVSLKTDDDPPGASVSGQVYDAPTREMIVWEAKATDGSCKLFTPRVPFCSTPCGAGNICVEDDTCRKQKAIKDVGAVTVTGIKTPEGTAPFDLVDIGGMYSAAPAPVFPPFAEGDDVSIATSGGDYAPFTLHAKAIAPLIVADGTLTADRNKPLALTWTPKGATSDATIHVKLDISHHGGSRGEILCDADDNGALTISAALVTQLLNLGVAGFPTITVTRQTASSTTIAAGRVDLQILHPVTRPITIPGLLSCSDTIPCPTGKTCQTDATCK